MYRVYVTDALMATVNNTSRYAGGTTIKDRYFDMVSPQKEETRTAEEIIEHIRSGLRGDK